MAQTLCFDLFVVALLTYHTKIYQQTIRDLDDKAPKKFSTIGAKLPQEICLNPASGCREADNSYLILHLARRDCSLNQDFKFLLDTKPPPKSYNTRAKSLHYHHVSFDAPK